MTILDDLKGKSITVNSVPYPDRKNLKFTIPGATTTDNPSANATEISFDFNSEFSNTEANGGNPTLKVAPEDTAQVSSLATAANADYDFTIGTDGIYKASISIVLKRASTGDDRTWSGAVDFKRASSTVTLIGSAVAATTGDATGLTIVVSGSSSNLRVNIANATGETVNGYVHVGWVRSDLVA